MTQLNEEHFETIDRNKDVNMQRNKIKFIENRLSNVEKAIESHAKILARFQMTEGVMHKGEKIAEDPADLFTKMMGGE